VEGGLGCFTQPMRLAACGISVDLHCEGLDALILEQRDLTFGKRMQALEVWRIAKAPKRLRRLVELCGIKVLTLAGFSWRQKQEAFRALEHILQSFAASELAESGAEELTARPAKGPRRRHSLHPLAHRTPRRMLAAAQAEDAAVDRAATGGRPGRQGGRAAHVRLVPNPNRRKVKARRARQPAPCPNCTFTATRAGSAQRRRSGEAVPVVDGSVTQAVLQAGMVELTMLVPLRHLALRVWAGNTNVQEDHQPALPATSSPVGLPVGAGAPPNMRFVQQWQDTLDPLRQLVAAFALAFAALDGMGHPAPGEGGLCEDSLYQFDLGAAWPWQDAAATPTACAPTDTSQTREAELAAGSRKGSPRQAKRSRGQFEMEDVDGWKTGAGRRAFELRLLAAVDGASGSEQGSKASHGKESGNGAGNTRPIKRRRVSQSGGGPQSLGGTRKPEETVGTTSKPGGSYPPKATRSGRRY